MLNRSCINMFFSFMEHVVNGFYCLITVTDFTRLNKAVYVRNK